MRITKLWGGGWALLCFCVAAGGATLLEDDFATDDNWVKAAGTLGLSLSNGTYVVENTGTAPGALRNDHTFEDFTYSVTFSCLSDPFSATGILFCWSSAFEGYMLTLSSEKMYTLHKWVRSGSSSAAQLITLGWNSFISTTDNVLTVSKRGSTLNLFCNNVFLTSVTDDSYGSGGVGLYVGPSEKAAFDHALVTDAFQDSLAQLRFCDDFSESSLEGWRMFTGTGSAAVQDDALQFSGGEQAGSSILITNGSYRDVPVSVVVSRTGGDPDGFAGLILMKIDVTMSDQGPVQGYDAYVFKTTERSGELDRYYAAHLLSTNQSVEYSLHQSSHIHGTTDTLAVTASYDFVVNGDTLPNVAFDSGLDFNAVGLIVDSGVVASFDDFKAGSSCSTPVASERQMRLLRHTGPSYILGGTGILYDPRGRRVGRYNRNRPGASRARLAPGTYLVAPEGDRSRRLRRAIVQIQ